MAPNLIDRIQTRPTAEPYEPDIAYLLSLISAWSYSEADTLRKVLIRDSISGAQRPLGIEPHSVRNPAFPVDVNAYLVSFAPQGSESALHVLCFRGTELTNIVDLLTDALVESHSWPKGRGADEWVHRGFFLSLDVLWPELVQELSRLEGRLYITGHSLGGALAVLAGRRFRDDAVTGPALRAVHTFGQPMVGSATFASAWPDLPLFRHVYHRDVVVRMPPRLHEDPSQDYQHFGEVLVPRSRPSGGGEQWTKLSPGQHAAEVSDASTACEGFDILPALLTVVTTRAPSLATEALELVANLPRATSWIPKAPWRLIRGERVIPASKYSINDHAPTYYVGASRPA